MTTLSRKVVAFDLDDTLYPEQQYMERGFQAASRIALRELGVPNLYDVLVEAAKANPTSRRVFNLTLERLRIPYDASVVERLVAAYHSGPPRLKLSPYDDVLPSLERLAKSFRLALITDGKPSVQRSKVASLGIARWFQRIYITDELKGDARKPSPVAFQQAMADFKVDGTACAYVANDPAKDFLAPNTLGWLTVQLTRHNVLRGNVVAPSPAHKAFATASSMPQIESILLAWIGDSATSQGSIYSSQPGSQENTP